MRKVERSKTPSKKRRQKDLDVAPAGWAAAFPARAREDLQAELGVDERGLNANLERLRGYAEEEPRDERFDQLFLALWAILEDTNPEAGRALNNALHHVASTLATYYAVNGPFELDDVRNPRSFNAVVEFLDLVSHRSQYGVLRAGNSLTRTQKNKLSPTQLLAQQLPAKDKTISNSKIARVAVALGHLPVKGDATPKTYAKVVETVADAVAKERKKAASKGPKT